MLRDAREATAYRRLRGGGGRCGVKEASSCKQSSSLISVLKGRYGGLGALDAVYMPMPQ